MIGNVHCDAFDERARGLAGELARIRTDFAALAGPAIEPLEERAVVAAGEEDVRVLRIGRDVARLGAARVVRAGHRIGRGATASTRATAAAAPAAAKPPRTRVARHADRAAVLLRAAHVIRQVLRRDHVVELARRIRARRPGRGRAERVVGDLPAAVIRVHRVVRVVGIDPEVVRVAPGVIRERLPPSVERNVPTSWA